jgi:class 3 adenylate cyclase
MEAVQCAVEAQAALAEANTGDPPDKHINFRIGIHIGDVMVRAGDLFGDGVNIAARLQTMANPGPRTIRYARSADDLREPWCSADEEHSRANQGLSGGCAQ